MSRAKKLAETLERYATYLKLDDQEGRAHAYERAARSLRQNGYVPPVPSRLDNIGTSVQETITEYQASGEITELQDLKEKYSWFEELRKIEGIGPARAQRVHDKFSIDDLDDLVLVGDDLTLMSGVGEKTKDKWVSDANRLIAEVEKNERERNS